MATSDLEYLVLFHNVTPEKRGGDLLLQRLTERFSLSAQELLRLRQDQPVVVKRHSNGLVAQKLCELLAELGAVSWVQTTEADKSFNDRRDSARRHHDERRNQWRKHKLFNERRQVNGRRRSELNVFLGSVMGQRQAV